MSYGDVKVELVRKDMLQEILPCPGTAAVAAAGICEKDNLTGIGITLSALGLPPLRNALDRKLRRVVREADVETAGIGMQVIDSIGHGNAVGKRAKIMIINLLRLTPPLGTGILEASDQLFFLAINTDQGNRFALTSGAYQCNLLELFVTLQG